MTATRRGCIRRSSRRSAPPSISARRSTRDSTRVSRGSTPSCRRAATPRARRQLIDEEIARLAQGRSDSAELTKARNQALAWFWRGLETIAGKARGARAVRGVPRRLSQAVRRAGGLREHHGRGRACGAATISCGQPHRRFARIAHRRDQPAATARIDRSRSHEVARMQLALLALLAACRRWRRRRGRRAV